LLPSTTDNTTDNTIKQNTEETWNMPAMSENENETSELKTFNFTQGLKAVILFHQLCNFTLSPTPKLRIAGIMNTFSKVIS